MNKYLPLFLFASCAVLFFSCNKKLSGIHWNNKHSNELTVREVDFDYFAGKAKISYKDDEYDINAKANVRMKKDSIIWISFSAAGITGGRCLINKDSIVVLNMLKKKYYVFEFEELSRTYGFDITFDKIQAATLGNLLQKREKGDELIKVDNFYVLKQKKDKLMINNHVSRKTSKLVKVDIDERTSGNTVVINYSNFQILEDSDIAFPYSGFISLMYGTSKGNINTIISMDYSKVEVGDKVLKFPFNIPKRYERQ